ncbi:hypothetical protein POM88_045201 [Heracleum sosnowskyi]|uniref:Uncharacterized protein n=1 Tax=Heracleum sosnowskyi TaxID=360622 RepID=A0AAD8H446_9APIA|nr:hypothetical protein POM88_045201 [Heracleum sosnowskyi]
MRKPFGIGEMRTLGVIPEDRYVVHQLTQRRADRNFALDVRPINSTNALARYLARHGAETWDRMVIIAGDLGLGPLGDPFMVVHELDLQANVENEDEVEIVEDKLMLAQEML